MRKCGTLIIAVFLAVSGQPKELTAHQIFVQNKNAIVRIFTNGHINGCGFIVSSNGVIVTANHVVTTEESGGSEVYQTIEIAVLGQRSHVATVINHSPATDTALLRIPVDDLPHVELGEVSSVKEADPTTLITYWPDGTLPILITGSVSSVGPIGPLGKNQLTAVIAQLPVRKGFSGSPIFNSEGRVIGIVTTRLVGISPDLNETRNKLSAIGSSAFVNGISLDRTLLDLINSLDSDLVSGLGSAVDISYAKQMLENNQGK